MRDFKKFESIDALSTYLIEAQAASLTLTTPLTIELGGKEISNENLQALSDALKLGNCPPGSHLLLFHNQIDDEGARIIAEALPHCPSGFKLDLYKNQIGDVGARAIAKVLPHGPSDLIIHLDHNKIGDAGARDIAEALPHGPSGLIIHLDGNQIGNTGARAIAEALPHGPSGLIIHLDGNQIGDTGARAIAEALPHCPSGLTIRLGGNQIGDAGACAIAEVLPHCPSGLIIFLDYNQIDRVGIDALKNAILRCPPGIGPQISLSWNGKKTQLKKLKSFYNAQQAYQQSYRAYSLLTLATLDQGYKQLSSPLSILPEEILRPIILMTLPFEKTLPHWENLPNIRYINAVMSFLTNTSLYASRTHFRQLDKNNIKTIINNKEIKLAEKAKKIFSIINDFLEEHPRKAQHVPTYLLEHHQATQSQTTPQPQAENVSRTTSRLRMFLRRTPSNNPPASDNEEEEREAEAAKEEWEENSF